MMPLKRLRRCVGLALLAVGALFWVLPLIPGTPVLVAAVLVLGRNDQTLSRWVERARGWRDRVRQRRRREAADA